MQGDPIVTAALFGFAGGMIFASLCWWFSCTMFADNAESEDDR